MSYTNLLYHIVYATKERASLITTVLRPRLHEYLGGTVRGLRGIALEVNGTADHVHVLAKLRPTISVSDFMSKLKSGSSGWAKRQTAGRLGWQARFGAFTVSESQVERVRKYIRIRKSIIESSRSKKNSRLCCARIELILMRLIHGDSLCRQLRRL
jgi:REP element-mobilizing transposase RayT